MVKNDNSGVEETDPLGEAQEERAEFADSDDNTQVGDAGIPGQIQYPERVVDAERAGEFAAGKVDRLTDEDDAVAEDDPRSEEQIEYEQTHRIVDPSV